MTLESKYFGLIDYQDGLNIHSVGLNNTIYGFEHPSTITLGIRGQCDQDLPFGEFKTKHSGFQIYQVDRGGHATLHNPGQLVIYPKLNLAECNLSVRNFVDTIQKTTIDVLNKYGIKAHTKCEPGVYVNDQKIAFLGLRIKKGTAHHGLSINIKNDISQFNWIRSCGVNEAAITSFRAQGREAELKNVFTDWVLQFQNELSLTQLKSNSTLSIGNRIQECKM